MSMYVVVVILSLLLAASVIGNIYQRRKLQAFEVFDPELVWVGFMAGTTTDWKSTYYNGDGELMVHRGVVASKPGARPTGVVLKPTRDNYFPKGSPEGKKQEEQYGGRL